MKTPGDRRMPHGAMTWTGDPSASPALSPLCVICGDSLPPGLSDPRKGQQFWGPPVGAMEKDLEGRKWGGTT